MRIFVSGVTGFVGRWLASELGAAGHQVVPAPGPSRVDVTEADAVAHALRASKPDAVVHLAAVASATDAAKDPKRAFEVAVAGTVNVMELMRTLEGVKAILIVGSSEVYGDPRRDDLPLKEETALRPRSPYALSKVAQESVSLAYATRFDLPVAVARSFNHIGPRQRPAFVVPALASRVLAVKRGQATDIPVGNVDVRRDFSDVRDVVRAYRLLLERLAHGSISRGGEIFNIASGTAVSIRHVVEVLAEEAGVSANLRVDPALVREDDPEEIRGDASRLQAMTGWRPEHDLRETLTSVWRYVGDDHPPQSATR